MKNAEIWYIVYANEREQQLNDTNKRHVFTESKTLRFVLLFLTPNDNKKIVICCFEIYLQFF